MTGNHSESRRALYLTEEEAMALLDICLYSDLEDDPMRAEAMRRVGDLCREFMTSKADDEPCHQRRPSLQGAFERMLRRRDSQAAVA